jgi:hypothetical protein
LNLAFIVGLTIDSDLSVLRCQRFFFDCNFSMRNSDLVVIDAIILHSHQVGELRLQDDSIGVLALFELLAQR